MRKAGDSVNYTNEEVLQYVREEDVKFIRLAFCDVFGRQKNIAIMPEELPRAFEAGIGIDASAIAGFGDETYSDLVLRPDPSTLAVLPWRPEHGRVVRMFCAVTWPDGRAFAADTRSLLLRAETQARQAGIHFSFGAEQEFYLFRLDESGNPTKTPYDQAGYMDIAPEDRGENIRREICLTLEQMGIYPESSHHEEGPGQNEIDFRYAGPVTAADNAMTFQTVVKTSAYRNGLFADFGPKPLADQPGNGLHINLSVRSEDGSDMLPYMVAGVMDKILDMTAFLNPTDASYKRFGSYKAPGYVAWSSENRSQLVRIPAASGKYRRAELRSPDSAANPYLAFALLIYAGLEGIEKRLELPMVANFNFFSADASLLSKFRKLPQSLAEAREISLQSDFIRAHAPSAILEAYLPTC